MVTCPPKDDPQFMLEQWIERRHGDEQEAVYPAGESPTLRLSLSALIRNLSLSQKPSISRAHRSFLSKSDKLFS